MKVSNYLKYNPLNNFIPQPFVLVCEILGAKKIFKEFLKNFHMFSHSVGEINF